VSDAVATSALPLSVAHRRSRPLIPRKMALLHERYACEFDTTSLVVLPTMRAFEADGGPALTARKCSQGWYTCMKLSHGVTGRLVYMYCEAMADLCI